MALGQKNRKTFFIFLLAFLIASFIVSAVEVIRSSFFRDPGPDIKTAGAVSVADPSQAPTSFADIVEKLKPAVVNISTTKTVRSAGRYRSPLRDQSPFDRYFGGDDFFERFFGDIPQREFKQKSLGSGFIISHDGYIFTNNHVVEQSEKIRVKLSDGREYDARIIGKDAKTDIALIKIKPSDSLPVVEIGDSEKLRVGDWVLAIGNPFGLEQTVTAGIVSAKGRVIGAGPYDNFIQTDASINPGNSGGPLFNLEGRVIGINTAIVAHGQGIGFAIPIGMAKDMLPDLKAKGKVTRGWMGISVQDITEDMARSFKLRDINGAIVAEVFAEDPADRAGLRAGDVIVAVGDKAVKDTHELLMMIASFRVGDAVRVKVLRDGQEKWFRVIVGERKDQPEVAMSPRGASDLGLSVQELTPELARYLGIRENRGIIVVDVEPGSPADNVGIQPQDIILQVNRVPVSTLGEYNREMAKKTSNTSILLQVKRGRTTFFVPVR
ncbi:MAG: DegQ family serine endoprotease [Syntrophales bacterium]|jgi:serine protease Do|nr:DegQ family serine endoprotease [Syntrophales bacterium]